jgi:hypothetical protein
MQGLTAKVVGFFVFTLIIFGIYHFTSRKHLQKYVDEFVFRYNTRNFVESQRFNLLLSNTEFRLTYKELIK